MAARKQLTVKDATPAAPSDFLPALAVVRKWLRDADKLHGEYLRLRTTSRAVRAQSIALQVKVGQQLLAHAYLRDGFQEKLKLKDRDADRCRAFARAWEKESLGLEPHPDEVLRVWDRLSLDRIEALGTDKHRSKPSPTAEIPHVVGKFAHPPPPSAPSGGMPPSAPLSPPAPLASPYEPDDPNPLWEKLATVYASLAPRVREVIRQAPDEEERAGLLKEARRLHRIAWEKVEGQL